MSSSEADVVVIGAGLSGLTAGYTIRKEKPSSKVLVLEATDRIGGPVQTVKIQGANGEDVWDVGAGRVGTKQNEIMGLIQEFGLETYKHFAEGKKFWILVDGTKKTYSGKIPPLPYTSLVDLLRYFNKVDGMSKKVNLKDAKATPKAEEWDNLTVDELKKKTLFTQVAKETIDVMTGMFFGLKCTDLSVMQYAYSIGTCGGWNAHIGGEGTGRMDLKVKGGVQQLVEKLSEHIGKDNVIRNAKVCSIEQQSGQAVVTTESGNTYTAKCIIFACIPTDAVKFSPPLSIPRLLPSADYGVQFIVTYQKSFWREAGNCAEVLNMQAVIDFTLGRDDHPIVTLFDHTSANGSPALMGVFGARSAKDKSVEDRKQLVLNFLQEIFETDEAKNILDYKDFSWTSYEKVPPPETFKETKPSEVLTAMTRPEGVIHWAGTKTAMAWADSLNGAVEAGQRAAREVIATHLK